MGRAPQEAGASHRESAGEGHESKQNVNQHHHTPKQPTMEKDQKDSSGIDIEWNLWSLMSSAEPTANHISTLVPPHDKWPFLAWT